MTVLTMPVQPGQDTAGQRAPVPWRGMLWVTWRQQRAALISVAVLLGAAATFLVVEGRQIHQDYAAVLACRGNAAACPSVYDRFYGTDWHTGISFMVAMHAIPVLFAMFTGPAVLARELETGTFRYAWTQGIGRVRWAAAKLIVLAVALAAATGGLGQLYDWFYGPLQTAKNTPWYTATILDTHGIVFAAWTLTAFCIGAFLGMLLRRILPAMAATFGVYGGLALLIGLYLRKDYPVALVTSNPSLFASPDQKTTSPWVLSTWESGGTQWWRYIPESRFWPMQFIEAGWLVFLSALLIAGTVWLVRRHAA
jgi:hypothetical protein